MKWLLPMLPLVVFGTPIVFRVAAHVARSFTSSFSILLRPAFAIGSVLAMLGLTALYALVIAPAIGATELTADEQTASLLFALLVGSLPSLLVVALAWPSRLLVIDRHTGTVCYGSVARPAPLRVIEHVDRVSNLSVIRDRVDLWGADGLVVLSHNSMNGNPYTVGEFSERALHRIVADVNAYVGAFRASDTDERRQRRRTTRDTVAKIVDARRAEAKRRDDRERDEQQARKARAEARAAAKQQGEKLARERKLAEKFRRM